MAANNGAQITLTIPSTGFSRVFVGATADDVEQQVEDFFEEDGADELSRFLEDVNARSPSSAGPADGRFDDPVGSPAGAALRDRRQAESW